MIELWLRSGTVGIVVVPFILLYGIAAGIVWLTHLSPARPFFVTCIGIAGPFFASVAVLFSLFAAFLANDVQHRNTEVEAAVFSEADGLRTILRLSEGLGPVGTPVRAAAFGYVDAVLTKEWPEMQKFGGVTEDLGALRTLTLSLMTPALTAATPPAVHHELLDGLIQVRQSRLIRVTLTAGVSDPMKWLAVVVLGVLTQIAVAVVQLEKMRPQALALFVFSTAFAATVVLMGLSERPFAGRPIDSAALRGVVAMKSP
jgi:uncharacterized membrane protein SirB2